MNASETPPRHCAPSRRPASSPRGARWLVAVLALLVGLAATTGVALATPWSGGANGNAGVVGASTGPAPSGVTLSNGTCSSATAGGTVSWNAVPGATAYTVEVALYSSFSGLLFSTTTSSTSTSVMLPNNSSTYNAYLRVRPVFGTWVGTASSTLGVSDACSGSSGATRLAQPSFTSSNSTCAASSPDAFVATENLAWGAIANATQYVLQASMTSDFSRIVASQTLTGTSTSLAVPVDRGSSTLYLRLAAENGQTWSPLRNATATITCPKVELAAPLNLRQAGPNTCSTTAGGYSAVVPFTWDAVPNATGYAVDVATDPNFTALTTQTTVNNTYATLTINVTSGSSMRYVRVRATSDANSGPFSPLAMTLTCPASGTSTTAPPSPTTTTAPTTTTPPTTAPPATTTTAPTTTAPPALVAPANFTAGRNTCSTTSSGTKISLPVSWSAVPGATGYSVDAASNSTFSSIVAQAAPTTTSTTLSTMGSTGSFTVYLRVRATNASSNGPYSTISTTVTC